MTVKEFTLHAFHRLKSCNIPSPKYEADLFICDYFGWEKHELILNESYELTAQQMAQLKSWLQQRAEGVPYAYIVGFKHFYKSKFIVNSHVLIPRPETELMVEHAVKHFSRDKKINILDVGCGSGCLGLSVLREFPNAQLVSLDISAKALEVTKQNAKQLDLLNRCDLIFQDFNKVDISIFQTNFDLVLANPPYIDEVNGFVEKNVKKFEPSQALFSEEKGLKDIKSWLIMIEKVIVESALVLMEFGKDQSQDILSFLNSRPSFVNTKIHKDYAQLPRYVSTQKS